MNEIKANKIYIVCPANNKTGGTELLHQLANELTENGKEAYLAYYFEGNYNKKEPTPEEFKKYKSKYCTLKEIEDKNNNLLILPEVCIGKQKKYKKIQKAVWWLSVDNFKLMQGKVARLRRYGFLSFLKHLILNDYVSQKDVDKIQYHLYQSYFAADFLRKNKIAEENMTYLSDYINDIYLNQFDMTKKDDIVIYNPKKGFEFTLKLIEQAKDINWIPIQNMTNIEVQNLMKRAKVYIDFGNHPGKDRIPREAAISGCCIITNRKGSAAFNRDVPILDNYKYEDVEENIPLIIEQIKECLNNYETCIEDYQSYREFIANEKKSFKNDVIKIFK